MKTEYALFAKAKRIPNVKKSSLYDWHMLYKSVNVRRINKLYQKWRAIADVHPNGDYWLEIRTRTISDWQKIPVRSGGKALA